MRKKDEDIRDKRLFEYSPMKAGFVAIVGRPSSGKSTLLNAICGHKVSIVSPVPQTTRNKIRGIYTKGNVQMVFIDTPGYHHSEKKINLHMKELVISALEGIDVILYVMDSARLPGEEEKAIMDRLIAHKERLVIAINKEDVSSNHLDAVESFIQEKLGTDAPFTRLYSISALQETGITALLSALETLLPPGQQMYPEDFYTDQNPEFRIAEIIREKATLHTQQELPHSIYVEIADMEMRNKQNTLWVRAFLVAERESQKGILVGKKGDVIRTIRNEAQKELKTLFPYNIYLDLRVKVHPKWRKKDRVLKNLIR